MLMKSKKKWVPYFLIFLLSFIAIRVALSWGDPPAPKDSELTAVMKAIEAKDAKKTVDKVTMGEEPFTVIVYFKDEKKEPLASGYPVEYGETIVDRTEKADLDLEVKAGGGSWIDTLNSIVPLLLLAAIVWFIFFGMGNIGSGTKSKAIGERPEVRFTDIAGADEAVEDVQEVTDYLKDPSKFEAIGAKAPKGILLTGPPGTGKTLLAKAVAGEAGVPFYAASGSDFIDMWVGTGARRIRKLFEEANKNAPAIIFIDELDGVGGKRSDSSKGADQEHNRTVNTLLTEMDGFKESNVIVMAATNNPDKLDSALVRPGRFDRKIVVDLPDWKGRLGILQVHSQDKAVAEDVQLDLVAKSTAGLAGADLANLINEALINAARNNRKEAVQEDFMEALSVVTLGRARKSKVMTPADKRVIACHEAGHAIVGMALEEIPDPTHVSILPRGMSGGHTKLQESEDVFQTSKQMKARMAMMLGGMVAERTLLGDITQGPGHDLQAATDTAMRMVRMMGMGRGLTVVDEQTVAVNSPIGASVYEEVEKLIQEALERAEAVFADEAWLARYQRMVAVLLDQDSIETEEIQALKTFVPAD